MIRQPFHSGFLSVPLALALVVFLCPGNMTCVGQEIQPDGSVPEEERRVAPLVIMENTDLTGRIIFMQEEDMDEEPGKNLKISIISEDKDDTIYETKTDDQGIYQIPRLDAGIYWMQVAQLTLRLQVNSVESKSKGQTPIVSPDFVGPEKPKVLVIFIPRDLG